MTPTCTHSAEPLVGLVLAGGSARGAYEVGVVQYIVEDVARALGRPVPLDILCGTSVGAVNACVLAALADDPEGRARRLAAYWTSLRVADIIRPSGRELISLLRDLFGRGRRTAEVSVVRGGILEPSGLEHLLDAIVPFDRIAENIRARRLRALAVSTTHVASGRTVVFAARCPGDGDAAPWVPDRTAVARATTLRRVHAQASAAVPLLFPAVSIEGQYFCDGGLRQNVPLSPARRLGATSLVIVSPRCLPPDLPDAAAAPEEPPALIGVLGKALNALLLDRVEHDVDRLDRINAILGAGCQRYGPTFLEELNRGLGRDPLRALRPLRTALIRASQDIARLAAEHARTPSFRARAEGVVGRLILRIAEGESRDQADLLSYVLYDGEFAGTLIELGRADARARHEDLCAFFAAALSPPEPGSAPAVAAGA